MNSFQTIQHSGQGYAFLMSIIQITLLAGKNVVYEFFGTPNLFMIDIAFARREEEPEMLVIKIFSNFHHDLNPLYYSAKSNYGLDREMEMCVEILTERMRDAGLSNLCPRYRKLVNK